MADALPGAPATTVRLLVEAPRDERWRAAAQLSGCALEDWMTRCLDAAASALLEG